MPTEPSRLETLTRLKETLVWLMQCRALQNVTEASDDSEPKFALPIDECDEFGINVPIAQAMLTLYPDIAELGRKQAEQIWHLLEHDVAHLRVMN